MSNEQKSLEEVIKDIGIMQSKIAEILGLHRATWINLKKDLSKITFGQIILLSEKLHITVPEIIDAIKVSIERQSKE